MNGNWTDLVYLGIPVAYLLSAAIAPLLSSAVSPTVGWRVTQFGGGLVVALSLTLPFLADPISGFFAMGAMHKVVLPLVAMIGFIVARFSTHYLAGEAGEKRFQRWLQLTLACVAVVVTTNHLALLIAAWVGISLSLHQLLMFYPGRKRAVLAAHKKFLFARLAESCLIGAAALLYLEHGTLFLDSMLATYSSGDVSLSVGEQIAALLIASAAMVKCAQFPMHGWLIQVVEAPTPVSALLHAGVINLGGFLMLLMAPLMLHAQLANWLLLLVAGFTCVAAALICMTRVSIKVLLAWSTVAQMGLMLVECALGQYGLALLHLVAHSCYKAYAFLSAGNEVENFLRKQLAPPKMPSAWSVPVLFLTALALVGALAYADLLGRDAGLWLLLAFVPLVMLTERASLRHDGSWIAAAGIGALMVGAYFAQKLLFSALAPAGALPELAQAIWCVVLFSVLLGAYWLLRQRGHSDLGRALYRNLYAGFYLDEWATRATLALWPANLPSRAAPRRVNRLIDQERLS